MGWIALAKPGDKYGPCKKPCKHLDCVASRKEAETRCIHCDKAIGYETKYYTNTNYDESGKLLSRAYEHFACAWVAEEKRRKEQAA